MTDSNKSNYEFCWRKAGKMTFVEVKFHNSVLRISENLGIVNNLKDAIEIIKKHEASHSLEKHR